MRIKPHRRNICGAVSYQILYQPPCMRPAVFALLSFERLR